MRLKPNEIIKNFEVNLLGNKLYINDEFEKLEIDCDFNDLKYEFVIHPTLEQFIKENTNEIIRFYIDKNIVLINKYFYTRFLFLPPNFRIYTPKHGIRDVRQILYHDGKIKIFYRNEKDLPCYIRKTNLMRLMQGSKKLDKNAKEIFEGHIIKFTYENSEYSSDVIFQQGEFYLSINSCLRINLYSIDSEQIEITGNIYETEYLIGCE